MERCIQLANKRKLTNQKLTNEQIDLWQHWARTNLKSRLQNSTEVYTSNTDQSQNYGIYCNNTNRYIFIAQQN